MIRGRRYVYGIPVSSPPVLAPTTMQSSVSQYGITWTFDQPYPVGQFVNGDYFVVGPVTITEIDPPWGPDQWGYMRNGTMINDSGGDGRHGLDEYLATNNTLGYGEDINIEAAANGGLPKTVAVNNSVISAIGRNSETGEGDLRPRLQSMAVLTVLSAAPYADAFRPSYVGTDKTIYRWSQVQDNLWRLPNLTPVADTPSVDSYIADLTRPWWWPLNGPAASWLCAVDNMPHHYHRNIGRFLMQASVLLMMDVADRDDLLKHYVQLGIDQYATTVTQVGSSSQWQWPLIFTGIMLGDDDIRDTFATGSYYSSGHARSMNQLYRIPEDVNSNVESSIVPGGSGMRTWTGSTAAWRQQTHNSNCYEQEHLHPSEWAEVTSAEGCSQNLSTRETYRRINSPVYPGFGVAAAVMNAKDRFYRSDLYFDYAERWMEETLYTEPYDAFDAYGEAGGLPYEERGVYPLGTGGGEYGSTTSTFVNNFWDAYYEP